MSPLRLMLAATLCGFVGAGLFAITFIAVTASADADGDPATDSVPRVLPYEGSIELDGISFTGTLGFRFTLYDDADNALWSETYADSGDSGSEVPVYQGVFSVLLGQYVSLTDAVLAADEIYVGVSVSDDDFATETALAGRQLLGPAPFALWSAGATNLTVGDDIQIGPAGGVLPSWMGESTTRGTTIYGGNDNAFFGVRNRSSGDADAYDTVIYYGDESDDDLMIVNEDLGDVATFSGDGDFQVLDGQVMATSGDNNVALRTSPNAGAEIRNDGGGTPFIDLANDSGSDYDARFLLASDSTLQLLGAGLLIDNALDVDGGATITGATSVTGGMTVEPSGGANNVDIGRNATNAAIELRNDSGGTPFIDFSNDDSTDFDGRFILQDDDTLELDGATFTPEALRLPIPDGTSNTSSGSNQDADLRLLTEANETELYNCDASTRGELAIARPSGAGSGDIDGLCFCGCDGTPSDANCRWHCITR